MDSLITSDNSDYRQGAKATLKRPIVADVVRNSGQYRSKH